MVDFGQYTVNGITAGAIYALVAVGFSLVWSARRTLNFAHGAFHMVGAYTAYLALSTVDDVAGASTATKVAVLALALAAGVAVAVGLSSVTYLGIYRPLRRAADSAPFIATLALGILLAEVVNLRTPSSVTIVPQALPADRFEFGGVTVSYTQVGVLAFALVLIVALQLFIRRTRTGRAIRAMATDNDAAILMGINTELLFYVTLTVATAIAVVAGVLVASYFVVINPFLGLGAAIKGLTAAVLGGLGNLNGAIIGGLALGLIEAHATSLFSGSWKDILALLALVAVLIVRPQGLLGAAGSVPNRA